MSEPMTFRVVGGDYDPTDDEGFRDRLVSEWYRQLAAQGATAVSVPVLERWQPMPDSFWLDAGLDPPDHQRDIGYIAAGLAIPPSVAPADAPRLGTYINLADLPLDDEDGE